MHQDRLTTLLKYYHEDPADPFNAYGLAMEYMKSDIREALRYFDELLRSHQDYVPTYYHAAKAYLELNDRDKAIEVYEKGIQIAKAQRESKALRELQSAYDELIFE